VSPLARLQAANKLPLTTLRHTTIVTAGGVENQLISLLDGTRTRADIYAELLPHLQGEKTEAQRLEELEISLHSLGRLSLLMS
jgi:hypothetical protein